MFKVGRAKLNCSVEEQNDNKYLTKGNIHKCGQSVKWIVLFCFFSSLLLHNRALIDERFSTPREKDDQHEYILLFQSLHRPHNLNLSIICRAFSTSILRMSFPLPFFYRAFISKCL